MRNKLLTALILLLCCRTPAYTQQQSAAQQIQLRWKAVADYDGKDNRNLRLVLKNISNRKLDLQSWDLWFNSLYPVEDKKTEAYTFSNQGGNLFKLQFVGQVIAPGDSLVAEYSSKYPISNISTMPNGFYLQNKNDHSQYSAVANVVYSPICPTLSDQNAFNRALFEKNEKLTRDTTIQPVFPTPKSLSQANGTFDIPSRITYFVADGLAVDTSMLQQNPIFAGVELVAASSEQATLVITQANELPEEAYRLAVTPTAIRIASASRAGVLYALQSLRSMLRPDMLRTKQSIRLPLVTIEDQPRYPYRGFMMDIARNFKNKATIMKYLDLMANYKLNVFHLHFSDDEGWRIEIPGLPELTAVGATRSPSYADGNSLQPAYGSGARTTIGDFLSRADFIAILQYAHGRNITVVPEIETPGHARAAIKSMQARYQRLIREGAQIEAERFRLDEPEDRSEYRSVQYFTDNVLNPALPATYTFLGHVIDAFADMYRAAGVPFRKISIGGDEVPQGAWTKSPAIRKLMAEQDMNAIHEIWPYYIRRVHALCAQRGIQMAGWEEIGMVNKGTGMMVNPALADTARIQVDVWNNVIGGGQEDLAYRRANAGYQTVLISASNLYFDMMWNANFMEPGLKWATYADLLHAYSLFPEDFFANIETYYSGAKQGKANFASKVRLTEKGKANFLGIKGGLWAETAQSEEQMDYLVFPRFFALAERAWSARRDYESEATFAASRLEDDYRAFLQKIARDELPKIATRVRFRLPAVGIKEIDGRIYANTEYPGLTIRYTSDGSLPTRSSPHYDPQQPIRYKSGQALAFAVVDADGEVGQVAYFRK